MCKSWPLAIETSPFLLHGFASSHARFFGRKHRRSHTGAPSWVGGGNHRIAGGREFRKQMLQRKQHHLGTCSAKGWKDKGGKQATPARLLDRPRPRSGLAPPPRCPGWFRGACALRARSRTSQAARAQARSLSHPPPPPSRVGAVCPPCAAVVSLLPLLPSIAASSPAARGGVECACQSVCPVRPSVSHERGARRWPSRGEEQPQ